MAKRGENKQIDSQSGHESRVDNPFNVDRESVKISSQSDNPFRPGSEIDREADEIVAWIKSGRPLSDLFNEVQPAKIPNVVSNGTINEVKNNNDKKVLHKVDEKVVPSKNEPAKQVRIKKKPKDKSAKCCVIQ